jgi:hypothetical protein
VGQCHDRDASVRFVGTPLCRTGRAVDQSKRAREYSVEARVLPGGPWDGIADMGLRSMKNAFTDVSQVNG